MSTSNAWSEYAAIFARTRNAHAEHEAAKSELKLARARRCPGSLRPWRSSQAVKIGAINFDVVANGGQHASLQ